MNDNVNYLGPVSSLSVEDRSDFIWKCYAHVVGAILGGGDVAWMAHIGGFLAGALFAYQFRVRPLHQVLSRT